MNFFEFKDSQLYAEDVKVTDLAKEFGTPLYVYSKATIERHLNAFENALASKKHLTCFAVKSCSNLAVLNLLAKLGAGFDIVSEGELRRVIAAGGDPKKVVFSGVGKTEAEIEYALSVGINCVNIESEEEKQTLVAEYNKQFAQRQNEIRDNYTQKLKDIENEITELISKAAQEKGYDMVLSKYIVLFGGDDITEEIMATVQ